MPYIDFLPTGGGGSGKDINKAVVTLVSNSFVYDGTEKTQAISSVTYNGVALVEGTDYVILTGSNKATNAGTHTISIAGIFNYSGVKNIDWSIAKASVTKPTITAGTHTYNGASQGPTITGFDSNTMEKSGDSAINAGSYTATISLKDTTNMEWADHTTTDITQSWSIGKASLTNPTVSANPVYTGNAVEPTLLNYDGSKMAKSGDTSGTNVGDYTLVVSLSNTTNYQWADGSTSNVSLAWEITKKPITKPSVSGTSFTYDGTAKAPTISGFDSNTMTKTGDSATNAGNYSLTIALSDKNNTEWSDNTSANIVTAWSIAKAQGSVSASPSTVTIGGVGSSETATLTVVGDGNVSVSSSAPSVISASVSGNTVTLTALAEGSATITVTLADGTNYLGGSCTISAAIKSISIYGVLWDKSSSTALSRTDDAALFSDPVPAVNGGTGSSPFDNLMPWSGMVKETIGNDVFVKIPKFWYKWTDTSNGLKLQIADGEEDGFHVSPAHADRGDGKGERDYVYIGRYHCDSNYNSKTGVKPKASITRAAARTGCTGRGTGYYQLDYAMWWTIRMLYLVEFADWNSQAKIGYGCGDNSATHNSGYSDTMQYHTGTMRSNRTTYGKGVQYRNIEDPWGNVCDWCDGIVLSSKAAYVTNDMSKYGESTTNHTKVSDGNFSSNCIKSWDVPSISGLEWALYPKETVSDSNYATYIADRALTHASYVVVYVGGYYSQGQSIGMFSSNSNPSSVSFAYIGARLQYLP